MRIAPARRPRALGRSFAGVVALLANQTGGCAATIDWSCLDSRLVPEDGQPDLILVGERVALGPLRRELAALQARWMNSSDVRFGLQHAGLATQETEETWIDETVKAGAEREPTAAGFMIYDRSDLAPVGNATLFSINHMNATSKYGILLGERRGKGFGTEATWLILGWAFETLGLRNVLLEVLAWNTSAIQAYQRAGFRRIGTRRGASNSRGARTDVVMMDAIPEDRPDSPFG
jgi:diamine N-acetyltransferase